MDKGTLTLQEFKNVVINSRGIPPDTPIYFKDGTTQYCIEAVQVKKEGVILLLSLEALACQSK